MTVIEVLQEATRDVSVRTPLRVLHYIGTPPGSGVDTFVLQLCAAQKRAGLFPAIALDLGDRKTFAAGRGVAIHPFPVLQGGELRLPRKLGALLLRLHRVRQLMPLFRKYDILHIHEGVLSLDAFVAARIAGAKAIVVTQHGRLAFHRTYWGATQKLAFLLEKRWASRIVMPYGALAEEYADAGVPEIPHVRYAVLR